MRLKITEVNQQKCIQCEKCVNICSVFLFSSIKANNGKKKIRFNDPHGFCYRCGHCLSICPTDAIEYKGTAVPLELEEAKDPESILSYDNLLKAYKTRRSIRDYKDKQIPKEKIEAVLEAIRYSPSASNRQRRSFIVLINKDEIKSLSEKVSRRWVKLKKRLKFGKFLSIFTAGALKRRLRSGKLYNLFSKYIEKYEEGYDFIFYDAPCVIILYSPKYSITTGNDAGIAFMQGMLAAQSLGLGTCWIGFAQEVLYKNKKLRRKIGIPKGHNCYGVLTLGYPRYTFEKAPSRRELKVKWIE